MNTAALCGLMPQHGWDATTLQDEIAPSGSMVEQIFSFSFVDEVFLQACLREIHIFMVLQVFTEPSIIYPQCQYWTEVGGDSDHHFLQWKTEVPSARMPSCLHSTMLSWILIHQCPEAHLLISNTWPI